MKNLSALFLATIAFSLLTSCAAFQIQRSVEGNTFVSNIPDIKIQVESSFEYVGNPHERDTSESISGRELDVSFDSYCFVVPENNIASREIVIQFHRTKHSFVSNFFGKATGLEKGAQDIGGKSFQYVVYSVHPTMDKHLTRHIAEKGYAMPHGLVKVFGRIYGAKGNLLVKVYYYESLDNSGLGDLSWKSYDNLSQRQREYLKEFNDRAESSFELLN